MQTGLYFYIFKLWPSSPVIQGGIRRFRPCLRTEHLHLTIVKVPKLLPSNVYLNCNIKKIRSRVRIHHIKQFTVSIVKRQA